MREITAKRWSDKDKEQAQNIVNDIAEDIDNGESREDLRKALAIYADWLHDCNVQKSAINMFSD